MGFESGEIGAALRDFKGVARRQHLLYNNGECQVYDDYGHHPREISSTLRALKPEDGGRLLTVFQPHRYTRTKFLWSEFSTAFGDASHVWLTDIYSADEKPIEGINGLSFCETLQANHPSVSYAPQETLLLETMQKEIKRGDRVLFLGAGSITKVAHRFVNRLLVDHDKIQQMIFERLCQAVGSSGLVRRNELMAKRTTWRVGGTADFYVEPDSEASLTAILQICHVYAKPFFIIGRGSNLLIRDGGYRGVVIGLPAAAFGHIRVDGERIICGAGARLRDVVMEAKRHHLAGLEFLEGIPGTVGGGLRMNAGAMQRSFFDIVEQLRVMHFDGTIQELPSTQVPVVYRCCPLLRECIALEAVLKGSVSESGEIEAKLSEYNQKRWSTQPAAPSAGCVFQNPPGTSAGKIIDEMGLKGLRIGGAVVSDKHANFLVNDGKATARDIAMLIDLVRMEVYQARHNWLQTEIQIIGEDQKLVCPECKKEGE
jgi:UDP-N-acetylenolpyruvoylglucosamine reductase